MNLNEISTKHPIFRGIRKLEPTETIEPGDISACVSCLLSVDCFEPWVDAEWVVGKTVEEALIGDMDARERVFARPI